ncbi:MAG TPA: hypothetical protein PLA01_09845 [Acetivibrio sp.]|jgi:hypothetical protein|nr:hypothetical protein [Acetivibrio sp.]
MTQKRWMFDIPEGFWNILNAMKNIGDSGLNTINVFSVIIGV